MKQESRRFQRWECQEPWRESSGADITIRYCRPPLPWPTSAMREYLGGIPCCAMSPGDFFDDL
jgi:hypothetical protein